MDYTSLHKGMRFGMRGWIRCWRSLPNRAGSARRGKLVDLVNDPDGSAAGAQKRLPDFFFFFGVGDGDSPLPGRTRGCDSSAMCSRFDCSTAALSPGFDARFDIKP